ncbi:MAG: peptide deformylase [Candidatus Doudnabacteria bacterium]|nr:peptide deformylase [Candidatus Doudnabacteria bacterium]
MLKIIIVPNPILNQKTEKVKKIDSEVLALIPQMIEACRNAQGIGLAAPQVGRSIRLCIINLEHLGVAPFALINPKITKKSWRKEEMEEGCLSLPGIYGIVRRPKTIKVKALNPEGQESEIEADGLLSRVIQHEVDHLDGILITSKFIRITDGRETKKRKEENL